MIYRVNKKLKIGSIIKIIGIVLLILSLLTLLLGNKQLLLGTVIALFSGVILLIIYNERYQQLIKSIKILESNNITLDKLLSDIDRNTPYLPISRLHVGENALITEKLTVILPYSSIAWIYYQNTKAYGILTIYTDTIIYTNTGEKFILKINQDELKWILENRKSKFSNSLILGYGRIQEQLYFDRFRAYKKSK